ncbi:MAG: glycosyltransferase family 39 protein, partial [Terrimicrobiaceae bacterium]
MPLLLALAAALTLGTAGWGDLYNETDGQYCGAAKVMVRSGSWLIPENDGIPRLVKPPLLYWAIAVSMKAFGINEFAARLPNALALTAWVGVTFLIGTHVGGRSRGFLAGIILLTSLGTFTLGRIVMPEPLFSAFIAAALYCA